MYDVPEITTPSLRRPAAVFLHGFCIASAARLRCFCRTVAVLLRVLLRSCCRALDPTGNGNESVRDSPGSRWQIDGEEKNPRQSVRVFDLGWMGSLIRLMDMGSAVM